MRILISIRPVGKNRLIKGRQVSDRGEECRKKPVSTQSFFWREYYKTIDKKPERWVTIEIRAQYCKVQHWMILRNK
jgi:hypothetical protein